LELAHHRGLGNRISLDRHRAYMFRRKWEVSTHTHTHTHCRRFIVLSRSTHVCLGLRVERHVDGRVRLLSPMMLRLRGLCGPEAKLFGLGLAVSGLGLVLGLVTSGLGLVEIGLVASKVYSIHDIN